MTGPQQLALVLLRTLVGWHFFYEGLFKLSWPAWGRDGVPLARWSSAAYLHAATGPLAGLLHGLASSRLLPAVDRILPLALLAVGLSLLLGVFTRAGCVGALLLLGLFYVSAIPTAGVPQAGTEGAYLLVNKNLVEGAAVLVLLAFGTQRIAGLDLLWEGRARPRGQAEGTAT